MLPRLGLGGSVDYLSQFAAALRFGAFNMAWVFVVLWGIERLWPRGRQATVEQDVRALAYWSIYLVAAAILGVIFSAIKGDAEPLVTIPLAGWLNNHWSLYVLGPLATMTLYDFFNYWMHRAQHKWFWTQHAVHHSIENISGLNSYFHWTEDLFRIAFISAPLTFLLDLDPGKSTVASVMFVKLYGNFIHSPTTLNLGPLGRVIVDNRWHRIHHSIEPQHWDKNFATGVTLWDHLFGTAYVPAKDEWPETGIADIPEHKTLQQFLWPWPILRRRHGVNVDPA